MASVNKAIVVGNLGRDPEIRYTQNDTAVCNFSVATTGIWKDKGGEKHERTEWHRIVAWGRLAEICSLYLQKGKLVYVEGRLQTRDWEDKDGQKRYTTEIVAQTMQMLGVRDSGVFREDGAGAVSADSGGTDAQYAEAPKGDDDDLPF